MRFPPNRGECPSTGAAQSTLSVGSESGAYVLSSSGRDVICAEGLGKRYSLGSQGFGRFFKSNGGTAREFWALDDISFSVKAGESLGIVGANGAGKSTLLKILSRITAPTTGHARIRGRVGTILEIGTGFHPELTGRENVYLSGAILGLHKSEIDARFEEIVAFADLSAFIDTPVKRYSSGMYVRLAFAVVAYLEPDILIVDEVLAVGDVGFQKKCLARMDEGLRREGRTILFVSHNFDAIRHLCTRAILLEKGRLVADGSVGQVLSRYTSAQQSAFDLRNQSIANRANRAAGRARFVSFALVNPKPVDAWTFKTGEPLSLRLTYEVLEPVKSLAFNMVFCSAMNGEVITSIKDNIAIGPLSPGAKGEFVVEIPALPFRPADIALTIMLGNSDFSVLEDLLDSNVNLPRLAMESDEDEMNRRVGYVDVPYKVTLHATVGL
jgi:lipopolysaccharide transport system ATP-binding protein